MGKTLFLRVQGNSTPIVQKFVWSSSIRSGSLRLSAFGVQYIVLTVGLHRHGFSRVSEYLTMQETYAINTDESLRRKRGSKVSKDIPYSTNGPMGLFDTGSCIAH